ncbi:MAG: asparagine synthase C-terminal domain-containing protein [Candidatus Cloacimonetes bacterium]|nr:asparagine synthase C-terminal domain-containing protein [Candidatus Cloacimonadota bacterium]
MNITLNPRIWHELNGFHVTGYLHATDSSYYEGKKIADYFAAAYDEPSFQNLLSNANGCFGCVCKLGETLFATVDISRSFPLFYSCEGWELVISDNTNDIEALSPSILNASPQEVTAEFLLTGFVTGKDTLHPKIKQIRPGNYIKWTKGAEPTAVQYYRYTHTESDVHDTDAYLAKLDEVHLALAERLVTSLQGRTAILPLSGGYDSRLIAWLLKRLNYPKVFCFSYGTPHNQESAISQAVAKKLGWDWRFIPYSRASWYKSYQSEQRKDYYHYAVNATSSPIIQDWLAVKSLHDKHIFPEDGVIIPGHSGDFVEGVYIPKSYASGRDVSDTEVIEQIMRQYYRYWAWNKDKYYNAFAKRIRESVPLQPVMSAADGASAFEEWDWAEHQAKFTVNSLKLYEFFGYSWRIPLWDRELMDFWSNVPLKLRLGRSLWFDYNNKYMNLSVPIFGDPTLFKRAQYKLLRMAVGSIYEQRYGRFAPYRNPIQYSLPRVGSILNPEINYPEFINPKLPILKADINSLQALFVISETKQTKN